MGEKCVDDRNIRRFEVLEKRNEEIREKRKQAQIALENLECFIGDYGEKDFKLLYNHPANKAHQSGKTLVKSTDIVNFEQIVGKRQELPVRYKEITADRNAKKETQYLCRFRGRYGDLWISETNLKFANAQKKINDFEKEEALKVKKEKSQDYSYRPRH